MTAPVPSIAACVFDVYGTLLDIGTATQRFAANLGNRLEPLTALWRSKQLEYAWLRTIMNDYADFWQVTGEALDYALAAHEVENPVLRSRLMEQYLSLSPYPDAASCLSRLRVARCHTAVLSNGTPSMLAAAVGAARLREHLDAMLSVDPCRLYKPHPSAYQLVCDRFDVPRERICFVSSNGWDIAGASGFGFYTVWANRTGRLPESLPHPPHATIASLTALPGLIGH